MERDTDRQTDKETEGEREREKERAFKDLVNTSQDPAQGKKKKVKEKSNLSSNKHSNTTISSPTSCSVRATGFPGLELRPSSSLSIMSSNCASSCNTDKTGHSKNNLSIYLLYVYDVYICMISIVEYIPWSLLLLFLFFFATPLFYNGIENRWLLLCCRPNTIIPSSIVMIV